MIVWDLLCITQTNMTVHLGSPERTPHSHVKLSTHGWLIIILVAGNVTDITSTSIMGAEKCCLTLEYSATRACPRVACARNANKIVPTLPDPMTPIARSRRPPKMAMIRWSGRVNHHRLPRQII